MYIEASISNDLQLNDPNISIYLALYKNRLEKETHNLIILSLFNRTNFYIKKQGSFNDFVLNDEKEYCSVNNLTTVIQEILTYQFLLANKKT